MLGEARPNKNYEKLDRAQNDQFWCLKTWGQGGPDPGAPRSSPGSASVFSLARY